ncbi:hypothetical protein DV515_00017454 [Chloebia gouldiae]|uniref:G-protein coupled receptors family 1 profile domain-containing protein n=1 Tax=Chloebia gouldiae TaxID=44316 RepID=A0A3L8QCH5_CHLGU|nr:hypothetical protein DV515_00017454 [Chloebia gouldiae]
MFSEVSRAEPGAPAPLCSTGIFPAQAERELQLPNAGFLTTCPAPSQGQRSRSSGETGKGTTGHQRGALELCAPAEPPGGMEPGWGWNSSHQSPAGHGQGLLSPAGDPNLTVLHSRDEELAKAEVGVLGTILAVATVGNLGVLLAVYRLRRKMSRMHLFILHLGLSDLGVALFQVLPQLLWKVTYRFLGPDPLCRAVKYLQVLSMFASTYMLMVMTLDRYLAVCHPLRSLRQPSRQAYAMIGATWLLSCLLSLPQVFIFSLREVRPGSGVLDCWADFGYPWGARAYITWTTLCVFVLPVGVLSVCYSLICHEICKNLKGKTQSGAPGAGGAAAAAPAGPGPAGKGGEPSRVSSVRTISRAKIRTVKMTFVIVAAYVTCWAPFFSVQMWSVWDQDAPDDGERMLLMMVRGEGTGWDQDCPDDGERLGGTRMLLMMVRGEGTGWDQDAPDDGEQILLMMMRGEGTWWDQDAPDDAERMLQMMLSGEGTGAWSPGDPSSCWVSPLRGCAPAHWHCQWRVEPGTTNFPSPRNASGTGISCPAPGDISSLSLASPESTNVAFSITMLLASLSSCCNPWIYLFFSGHLLQDAGRCRGCWGRPRAGLRRPNSTGSLCSRKTTILSHSQQAGRQGAVPALRRGRDRAATPPGVTLSGVTPPGVTLSGVTLCGTTHSVAAERGSPHLVAPRFAEIAVFHPEKRRRPPCPRCRVPSGRCLTTASTPARVWGNLWLLCCGEGSCNLREGMRHPAGTENPASSGVRGSCILWGQGILHPLGSGHPASSGVRASCTFWDQGILHPSGSGDPKWDPESFGMRGSYILWDQGILLPSETEDPESFGKGSCIFWDQGILHPSGSGDPASSGLRGSCIFWDQGILHPLGTEDPESFGKGS